jgi:hypothetical protein
MVWDSINWFRPFTCSQDPDVQQHKSWCFCVQWFKVTGGCKFCWYWWNCWSWPSLFNTLEIKVGAHTKHCTRTKHLIFIDKSFLRFNYSLDVFSSYVQNWKYTLEKTEGAIKKGQSRESGNIWHTRRQTKQNTQHNTTQKAKKMNNIHPTKKPRVNIGAREG